MIMNYLAQLSEKSSEKIEVMSERQRSELFSVAFQKMRAELYRSCGDLVSLCMNGCVENTNKDSNCELCL